MTKTSLSGWQDELLDRELVLTRVVDAPRDLGYQTIDKMAAYAERMP